MDRERTACEDDHQRRRREWVEDSPPLLRGELLDMLDGCQGCPLKQECLRQGLDGERDLQGRVVSGATGVYGGYFFRSGKVFDLLNMDERQSIYRNVHWDMTRGRWHAQGEGHRTPDGKRVRTHILYSDSEDEAGLAALEWRDQQGQEAEVIDLDAARAIRRGQTPNTEAA